MGGLLDGVEQTLQDLHDWFYLVAIALVWLSVVSTVSCAFLVWGMLRIAKLVEINVQPRNPPPPSSYITTPQGSQQYGPRT